MVKNNFIRFCICAVFALSSTSCAKPKSSDPDMGGKINIGVLNGPTMVGMGELYHNVNEDKDSKYKIVKENAPDAIIAGLSNKTLDVACLPANNAAILFNNKSIDIKVAIVNTLNVLYLLQKDGTPTITSLSDLSGKTVYLPGQGSTPEFVLRYLLSKNNISNVTLEFETDATLIVTGLKVSDSKYNYALLPQPAATVALSGAGGAKQVLNLSDEWLKVNPNSDIVMGVLVVRTAYLAKNKKTFTDFLASYKQSVEFMTETANIDVAASYVVDMGVVPAAPIAKLALPKCGIVYKGKTEMKNLLEDFYNVLLAQNADAIGGKLPTKDFYYI
jgi:NitT/TauT family transport system substrate-binding protein